MNITTPSISVTDELFDKLAINREPSAQSSYIGASNPCYPDHLLVNFAMSDCPKVRTRLAENPSTPHYVLLKLCTDENAEVRAGLGENPNTPEVLLWTLASDESSDVRYSLAENHQICFAILEWLCKDENPYVSSRAQKTCAAISRLAADSGTVLRVLNVVRDDCELRTSDYA